MKASSIAPLAPSPAFEVLGVRVNAVQIPDVIARVEEWISHRANGSYIAVTGMHGVTEARRDPSFKSILNAATLVVPDGMPLVWIGRHRGFSLSRRVYGPEFMWRFCRETLPKGYRHFLYGGSPEALERLAGRMLQEFPGIRIAGTYSPPFRPLTPEEDRQVVETLNASAVDVLWVGLSTPKQERWMYQHRERLNVPAMIGVGAAFDINSGTKRQAPPWIRESGLEWAFRLVQEPRRLWKRYLLNGSEFAVCATLELLGWRRFD